MVLAMHAKYKPVPPRVAVLSKRIDISPDWALRRSDCELAGINF